MLPLDTLNVPALPTSAVACNELLKDLCIRSAPRRSVAPSWFPSGHKAPVVGWAYAPRETEGRTGRIWGVDPDRSRKLGFAGRGGRGQVRPDGRHPASQLGRDRNAGRLEAI